MATDFDQESSVDPTVKDQTARFSTPPWMASATSAMQLLRRVRSWVATGWNDAICLQERLLLLERPWESEGPLRWSREIGGHRLVGQEFPPHLDAPVSMGVDGPESPGSALESW